MFTWGRNESGQLGHGDLMNRNIPTVVKVGPGSCCLPRRGMAFCDQGAQCVG